MQILHGVQPHSEGHPSQAEAGVDETVALAAGTAEVVVACMASVLMLVLAPALVAAHPGVLKENPKTLASAEAWPVEIDSPWRREMQGHRPHVGTSCQMDSPEQEDQENRSECP